ncbi:hypothetical protein SeMB42_g03461 [Synchytrium endobioticum]|uniref:UBX domain-containing protein n=1 Tax=Synchytrium endobioticum TaxID=286115 RepID=A0A507D6E3_9FUNG|nr:hypothetical protein SeMB42_g03461 [Synchytrium endobioticum]TPX47729.1 hypothetical protein SeLEV6574_g02490 [Synchytrium endobioticum]
MPSDRQQLLEMGFAEAKVDKALKATHDAGLQPAMEWLFEHTEDPDTEMTDATPNNEGSASADTKKDDEEDEGEVTAAQATAQSLKCDDCGKMFRDSSRAQLHAAKSGHVNFSESTEALKPLTDEEKKAKLADLQARLVAKREAKRQAEIEETKLKEKVRRASAKEIEASREKFKELEMKRALSEKERERKDELAAKAKIKAQIEQDKLDRQRQREAAKSGGAPAPVYAAAAPAKPAAVAAPSGNYATARIQIRPSNGPPLVQIFQATDKLSDVYAFVASQRPGEVFKLVQTFPRKVLEGAEMGKTLKELSLVPSAALAIQ